MKKYMKHFLILILGQIIGYFVYVNFFMHQDIEQRAKELNILKYNSKENKFVMKDSVVLDNSMFEYLKHGKNK